MCEKQARDCSDMECHTHGVAASLARTSEFYSRNDRTIVAGPDECMPREGYCVNEDDDCFDCREFWLDFHAEGLLGD